MISFPRSPFEEALTLELAVQRYAPDAELAVDELTALGDARALPGPVQVTGRERSFITEAREELADARNYLVWHHRDRRLNDAADDELAALERALAALAIAWLALNAAATASSLGNAPTASGRGGNERSTERQPTATPDTGRLRAVPSRGAQADRPVELVIGGASPVLAAAKAVSDRQVEVAEPLVVGSLSCGLSDCRGIRLYEGGGSITCTLCLKSISEETRPW